MTDESNPEGLSKNQLKKLQKKAEKKAAKGGGGGADPSAGGGGGAGKGGGQKAAPAANNNAPKAAPKIEAPTWTLCHAQATNPATLKVVLASQVFGVPLEVATRSDLKKHASSFWLSNNSSNHKTALLLGDHVVGGGGGNAMAKAILTSAPSVVSTCVPARDLQVDEWCEWERTMLRVAYNPAQVTAALAELDQALAASGGVHLVHHQHSSIAGGQPADTLADIVLTVTLDQVLSQYADQITVPPAVATYRQAHSAKLEQAKQTALGLEQDCIQAAAGHVLPLDLNHPSMLRVVTAIFQHVSLQVLCDNDEDLLPKGNMVAKCKDAKHGDYQCTVAMPLFQALKKLGKLPPNMATTKDVAQLLVNAIGTEHPVVTDLQVNGPGFVSCRIRAEYLQTQVAGLLQTGQLPKPPHVKPCTCIVDFSSPNIAKEMHVGHLRSTIIGEAVCRILEFCGHSVHRTNHVGDWGTQFGMLIQYLTEEYPDVGKSDDEELPNITDLTVFYKNAKQRFDESPEFKKTSQTNVVKLQSGDPHCLRIWKLLCDVSRKEFQKVYDRLDVTVKEKGESFYNDKIPPVVAEFNDKGLLSVEEGGAKCVFVEGFAAPLMLQKSDGGFGYDSTDMAALKHRLFDLKAERIIVITDYSQADHFTMCYAAARKMGWVQRHQRLEHIGFGTVQGEDGKRFKTRSGDTVRLVDLLDEAVSRMEASLKARIEEKKANITLDEVHEVAEAIGYGAVKYYDLRRNPTTNYKFSYDQMLDTKGDTAVYLLYARVRLESICAKAKAEHNVDVEELVKAGEKPVLSHEAERNLALQLHMFADVLDLTLEDLFPYHICNYVYDVCTAASDFVTKCKVLGSPEMNSRLLLCHATTTAMHQCFDLLGIRHVKRI